MEEFKEVTKDGVVYAKLVDGSKYEKQDNIYIYQTNGYLGDDYSGTIIKPITDIIGSCYAVHMLKIKEIRGNYNLTSNHIKGKTN